jgi:hypothetical protein
VLSSLLLQPPHQAASPLGANNDQIARGDDLALGPEKVRREIQLQARLSHVNIVELKQVRFDIRFLL